MAGVNGISLCDRRAGSLRQEVTLPMKIRSRQAFRLQPPIQVLILICASGIALLVRIFGIGKEGRAIDHIGIAASSDRLGDPRINS